METKEARVTHQHKSRCGNIFTWYVAGATGLMLIAAAILCYSYWIAVQDYYASMAAAELIITYRNDFHDLPRSWQDLESVSNEILYRHGFVSISSIQSRVCLDFHLLQVASNDSNGECAIKVRSKRLIKASARSADRKSVV